MLFRTLFSGAEVTWKDNSLVSAKGAESSLLGDANNDGMINVNDITTVAMYILKGIADPWNFLNADVNCDGIINVNDITGIATLILQPTVLLGDANADGMINVNDITTIATYILKGKADPWSFKNADVNEDGIINVNDITGVATMILKK